MSAYTLVLVFHIAAGSVGLVTYWMAGLSRKGSPFHRRAGQIYLLAMLGVILSGVPLAMAMLERGRPVAAAFLGYLLVLVSLGCWSAWRAIRDRRQPQRFFGPVYWTLSVLTAASGIGVSWLGWRHGATLLLGFGMVGVVAGAGSLLTRWRSARDPRWWLREHYGAMIGNGVATHIAFFSIGLRNVLPGVDPGTLQLFAWFTPVAVAVMAGIWISRKYGRAPNPPIASSRTRAGATAT